jgi:hypothetical protein
VISALDPEAACALQSPLRKGQHYYHWTAEVYGLGKAYRNVLGLESDAYLPFTSDHGVTDCASGFEEHEINSPLHVTFQEHRHQLFQQARAHRRRFQSARHTPRRVVRLEHPYIGYVSRLRRRVTIARDGTLIFFPHSTPSESGFAVPDIERFFAEIRGLPEELRPVSLMVHQHDVDRGLLRLIEGEGIRALSAGNPMHPDFIDRLVEAVGLHTRVGSSVVGTEAFLSSILGVKFFLLPSASPHASSLHHGEEFEEQDPATIRKLVAQHLSQDFRASESDVQVIRALSRRSRTRLGMLRRR